MGKLSGAVFLLIFGSLSVVAAHQTAEEKAKYGSYVGDIPTIKYGVKGKVYAMNQHQLFIRGFSYDGKGLDPVFQIKNKGHQGTALIEIPYPKGSHDHLTKTDNADIVLELPVDQTVSKIDTLYVRARTNSGNDEAVYGSLTFNSDITIPQEKEIKKFTEIQHGLKSNNVIIKDAKTLFIPNFHYDGTAPAAYFYVGSGQGVEARKNPETIVNFEKEGDQRLKQKYSGANLTITLPGNLTVYDIGWLSVWCVEASQEFGHVDIPNAENLNVPPYMGKKAASVSPPKDTPREEKNDTTNGATFLLTNFILFATTISTIAFIY